MKMSKVTRNQYEKAQNELSSAQSDSIRASRAGDQVALDAANDKAVAALAVIADYKDQGSGNPKK
jgi:hypothetical protein